MKPHNTYNDLSRFEPADRYEELGLTNGQKVIGHTLVWHNQTPAWVFAGKDGAPLDRETALGRMQEHIRTVVGRYKGRIHGWDVVNEAIEDDGTMRASKWAQAIGEDYIAKAFQFAHEADPGAELYYNDYNLTLPAKRATAIALVKKLRAQGLRVDGIGEQGHWLIDRPDLEAIEATITDIAGAGLKVLITELDVDVLPRPAELAGADLEKRMQIRTETNLYPNGLPAEAQERLARRYADVFGVFLKHRDKVTRITFWGLTDGNSWLNNFPMPGRVNHPLLWDRDAKEKAAYRAVVDVLKLKR
jgi:endo-1,4-beta-xylanase